MKTFHLQTKTDCVTNEATEKESLFVYFNYLVVVGKQQTAGACESGEQATGFGRNVATFSYEAD